MRPKGTSPNNDLISSIEFVYAVQTASLPDNIPPEDLEVLESYRDPGMFLDVEDAVDRLQKAHLSLAHSRGIEKTRLGRSGYIELLGLLGAWLVENKIDRLPDRIRQE